MSTKGHPERRPSLRERYYRAAFPPSWFAFLSCTAWVVMLGHPHLILPVALLLGLYKISDAAQLRRIQNEESNANRLWDAFVTNGRGVRFPERPPDNPVAWLDANLPTLNQSDSIGEFFQTMAPPLNEPVTVPQLNDDMASATQNAVAGEAYLRFAAFKEIQASMHLPNLAFGQFLSEDGWRGLVFHEYSDEVWVFYIFKIGRSGSVLNLAESGWYYRRFRDRVDRRGNRKRSDDECYLTEGHSNFKHNMFLFFGRAFAAPLFVVLAVADFATRLILPRLQSPVDKLGRDPSWGELGCWRMTHENRDKAEVEMDPSGPDSVLAEMKVAFLQRSVPRLNRMASPNERGIPRDTGIHHHGLE